VKLQLQVNKNGKNGEIDVINKRLSLCPDKLSGLSLIYHSDHRIPNTNRFPFYCASTKKAVIKITSKTSATSQ